MVPLLNFKQLNAKYVGKEVIFDKDKKGRIAKLTSYEISVTTGSSIWTVFKTGTGEKDNAVARGDVKFVDEALNEIFIREYEAYTNSKEGRIEAYVYYSQIYD